MTKPFANNGDSDQMPHFAASGLGLHCLSVTLLGVSRLKWVKVPITTEQTILLNLFFVLFFIEKEILTFHVNHLPSR